MNGTQEEKQKIINAVKTIGHYCQSHTCNGCMFASNDECALTHDNVAPHEWIWLCLNMDEEI